MVCSKKRFITIITAVIVTAALLGCGEVRLHNMEQIPEGAQQEEIQTTDEEQLSEGAPLPEEVQQESSEEDIGDEWYTYTGYVKDFREVDLDGDGLADRLYRTYEENRPDAAEGEESYAAGYELHFGNGDKLLLNRSSDIAFFYVAVDSMDLTGDGKKEIIVMDEHAGSTNPPASRVLSIYAHKEDGYYRLKLPGQEGEEWAADSRGMDEDTLIPGIPISAGYNEDNTILLRNGKYGYEETAAISASYMSNEHNAGFYIELDGTAVKSNIHRYEPVIKGGRTALRVSQQVGFKGLAGDVTYLLSWEEDGDYSLTDITFEAADYLFDQYERYEAGSEFNNLNIDSDGIPDKARMYDAGNKTAYVEIEFGNGRTLTIRRSEKLQFTRDFKIMAVDCDSDGEKEIFVLLNTGKQGGEGEYTLAIYDLQGEEYVQIEAPGAFPYKVTGNGERIVLSCEELDYEEELFSDEMIAGYYTDEDGTLIEDLWTEKRKQAFGTNMAEGFCDFSFYRPENGTDLYRSVCSPRIKLKQYLYGEGHSDMLAYVITSLVYEDGAFKAEDISVQYPPVQKK